MSVWAPTATSVDVVVTADGSEPRTFAADRNGEWFTAPDEAAALIDRGATYAFAVDDESPVPDPRAPWLPAGVHAPGRTFTVDPDLWTDADYVGRSVSGAVLYEMHVGTFTEPGTFDAAAERLDHLVELGVDFVEVMPVNAVNGDHNWGYDGVGWYAVHEPYGGPAGFARFVDACHGRGLGVVLDVVYNHLGPSGNYLPRFGPYLTEASTGWGQSLNLDEAGSDEVRRYIIDNALRWFDEFHVDGLRLDAVHALVDRTAVHLLEELATATDALSARIGRPLSLIAESDLNDPRMITPRDRGGLGMTAQWDDDVHHAIHTAVSGERQGYYADFGSLETLSTVLRRGFFHAMTYSSFRGRRHGRPIDTAATPATALVVYTCDHDQIGNRAVGDRPSAYLDHGQLAIKASLVLLSAFTPMLFMGEEWAASTPFQFFTSHPEPELGRATAEGRKAEFAAHGWDAAEIPDPQDPETFRRSKLDWSEVETSGHRDVLDFYRRLIALRTEIADFAAGTFASVDTDFDPDARWFALHRGGHTVLCNLGAEPVTVDIALEPLLEWHPVSTDGPRTTLTGHSVVVGRRLP
ncbi:maltooligosyl trehalose hydrolase [Williamsia sterculiae]|uniref:Malto-oligosyltrehalose trehalohydrolase n=1 Tax=Williamsia sterculiae TaxID=1344003 RepID=A0A1N7H664_9NOCA|nr:maltooligosyl trehalose hydrolase [Williamsia sterculiae]